MCDPTPYSGTSTSAVPYKTHIFSTNIHFIQPPAAGAAQWRLANRRHACPLLERCCMGVVSQIKDLDNSSKPLPCKSYATSTVGEGLVAQPQTAPLCPLDTSPTGRHLPKPFRSTPPKCGADQNALPRGVINVAPCKSAVAFSELTEADEKKHLLLSKPYVIITLFASRPRCG